MKIVGYTLNAQFNDSYMYDVLKFNPAESHCSLCGYRLELFPTNPEYILKKKSKDFGVTYDSQCIVSKAFKSFCGDNGYEKDLIFKSFEKDPEHFHLVPKRQVEFNSEKRKTRFENLCLKCKNFESVIGADPTYLLVSEPLKDGFWRSNLAFGSESSKSPLILVGMATRALLKASGLKGLEFKKAYGLD